MANPFFEKLLLKIMFQQRELNSQRNKTHKTFKNEFETLALLKSAKLDNANIFVSDLAKNHDMPMSGVSRLLKNMEEKELVIRTTDSSDRRNTIVAMTKKGENMYEEMLGAIEKQLAKSFSAFTDEERKSYIQLTAKRYGFNDDYKE